MPNSQFTWLFTYKCFDSIEYKACAVKRKNMILSLQLDFIMEFTWTMPKLQLLVDTFLSGDNDGCLIHLTKLLKEIGKDQKYQDIELKNYDIHKKKASKKSVKISCT